jgi:hypothetical protein
MTQKIPINRIPASELLRDEAPMINDAQSAIDQGLSAFQGGTIDHSLLQDDPDLANPHQSAFAQTMNNAAAQEVAQEPTEAKPARETNKEYNLRMMREQKEAVESELKQLKQQMGYQQQHEYQHPIQYNNNQRYNFAQQPQQQQYDLSKIADDALLEGRDFKLYLNQAKEELRQELQGVKAESAATAATARLRMQYNDFDQVVSKENIKDFAAARPPLYRSMLSNPDMYDAGDSAYWMIKKFILEEDGQTSHNQQYQPQRQNYDDSQQRIQQNLQRPRTAAKIGTQGEATTLGRLTEGRRVLTESDKQRTRELLEKTRKFGY